MRPSFRLALAAFSLAAVSGPAVVVTVSNAEDLPRAEALLRGVTGEAHVDAAARQLTAPASRLGDMTKVANAFDDTGIELDDLGLKRPSLDDVFLHLTGHRAEQAAPEDEEISA